MRADALEIEVEQLRAQLARATHDAEGQAPTRRLHLEPVRSDDRPRRIQAPELIASAEENVHTAMLRDRIFLALKTLPVSALEQVLDLSVSIQQPRR
jgi:hypothetical protein